MRSPTRTLRFVFHAITDDPIWRELSNNIIQKGLAFIGDWSGTMYRSGRNVRFGILPRRRLAEGDVVVQGGVLEPGRRLDRGDDLPGHAQLGEGAERGRDPALGDHTLARGKKNARRRRAWIVFQDESGVSQRPPVRRTWAPRGETPVLIHAFNWAKLSLAVALAFRWDGRRSGLFFQTRPGSYNDVALIGFLNALQRHFRGRRLILIWDGLPSHKSRDMTAYLRAQRAWLTVERLPGYAPELNPTELVWGNVKGRELAKDPTQNNLNSLSFSSIVSGWPRQQNFEIGCWR